MNTATMVAVGAVVFAVLVPQFIPESSKSEQATTNVIRQAEEPTSIFGGGPKKKKKKVRRSASSRTNYSCDMGCGANGGLITSSGSKSSRSRNRRKSSIPTSYVEAGENGLFQTNAKVNGRRIPVLVDTGASAVAINQTTARKLGINVTQEDFKYEAQTANGNTKYAKAQIRSIRIGRIVVDDVEAIVLSDKSLSSTLVGMSFLKRLTKYTVESGKLKMVQ